MLQLQRLSIGCSALNGQPAPDENEHPHHVGHDLGASGIVSKDHQAAEDIAGWRARVAGDKGVNRRRPYAARPGYRRGKQGQGSRDEATADPDLWADSARSGAKVNDGDQGQPRQEGTGFDRVPRPIAAPVKDEVGPQAAKSDAERGHEQAGARQMKHALAQLIALRGVGGRQGNRRQMKAQRVGEEDQRWMNDHQVGLQERIEACTDEERRCGLEGIE